MICARLDRFDTLVRVEYFGHFLFLKFMSMPAQVMSMLVFCLILEAYLGHEASDNYCI